MAPAVSILVGLLAASAPPPARPIAGLRYHVEREIQGCPAEPELRAEVNRRLGYAALDAAASGRVVEARIVRREEGLLGVVSIWTDKGVNAGQRTLTSPAGDCAELAAALSLAISIAIDSTATLEPRAIPVAPAPGRVPPPAPMPIPPPATAPPPSAVLFAGAALAAGWGSVPGVSPGLTLRTGARVPPVSIALEVRGDLPFRAEPTSSGDGQAFSGTLAGCLHPGPWAACLSASGGAVAVRLQQVVPVGSAGARVQYEHPLGDRLLLHGALDVHLTVFRIRFVSNGSDVWAPPPVYVSTQVGASWLIP